MSNDFLTPGKRPTQLDFMPSESFMPIQKHTRETPTRVELEKLYTEIEHLIFTDFESARNKLQMLHAHIHEDTPYQTLLIYHNSMAFLENQDLRLPASLAHLDKSLEILEALADPLALADAHLDYAAVQTNMRLFEDAEKRINKAAKLLALVPEPRLRARLLVREGFLQFQNERLQAALEAFLQAESLFLGLGENAVLKDYYLLSLLLSGLGELYDKLNDKDKSVRAYLRVLEICEKYHLRPRLAWHYLNGGRAYFAQNDEEEAHNCFQNALSYADVNDLDFKANVYANFGISAYLSGDLSKAMRLFNAAKAIYNEPSKPQDFLNLAKIESWIAEIFQFENDLQQANVHFSLALEYSERSNDQKQQSDICAALANLHVQLGDYEAAYRFQKTATECSEKHAAQVHNQAIRDLEARYDVEKGRQEANMAKLRLTGLQLRALRAQMNPHFLFNALNAIQGFITSGKSDEAENYLARFAKLMRKTLDYSDWEVVSLETEMEFLEHYLDLNKKLRFQDKFTFQINVDESLDADGMNIPTMIVQPFVENAIEHGIRPQQGGKIVITFELSKDEETILCSIEDDGIGFNKSREAKQTTQQYGAHKSKGLEITRERLALLHKQQGRKIEKIVKIIDLGEKSKGKRSGTRVEVILPILEDMET